MPTTLHLKIYGDLLNHSFISKTICLINSFFKWFKIKNSSLIEY